MLCYEQNTTEKWTKGCILPFLKKSDLGITNNYGGRTLTAIGAKVKRALLLNRIKSEIKKILLKTQNDFLRYRSKNSWILTIHRIIEERMFVDAKESRYNIIVYKYSIIVYKYNIIVFKFLQVS